jgi:hypothetical protein
VPTDDP